MNEKRIVHELRHSWHELLRATTGVKGLGFCGAEGIFRASNHRAILEFWQGFYIGSMKWRAGLRDLVM